MSSRNRLIGLLEKYDYVVVFLLLVVVSVILMSRTSYYQSSKILAWTNSVAGGWYQGVHSVGGYFDLKGENDRLAAENARLKEQLASSTFVGTRFSSAEPGTADQYQFLTYTVRVSNRAFLTADILELRITPMEGDVLQIGDLDRHTLASGKDMELSATILTTREMHSIREATVTYYFWGIPLSTKLTLGK